jgi:hypothetical protein
MARGVLHHLTEQDRDAGQFLLEVFLVFAGALVGVVTLVFELADVFLEGADLSLITVLKNKILKIEHRQKDKDDNNEDGCEKHCITLVKKRRLAQ